MIKMIQVVQIIQNFWGPHVCFLIVVSENLFNEATDLQSSAFTSFCCRNTTTQGTNTTETQGSICHNNTDQDKMNFTSPFYLFPICNFCPGFTGATSNLDYIELNSSNSASLFNSSNRPHITTDSARSRLFLCYYQPENNADEIIIEPSGPIILNYHFPFRFRVLLRSKGVSVRTGVDSSMSVTASKGALIQWK